MYLAKHNCATVMNEVHLESCSSCLSWHWQLIFDIASSTLILHLLVQEIKEEDILDLLLAVRRSLRGE